MTKAPRVKVLLVEDEGLIRMMMFDFLTDEGFDVTEAWSGDEAVRLLDGPGHFNVLFTDVQMAGTRDGVDVAMHARQRYPRMPILVVSGYAAALMSRLGALDPAARFLSKPYFPWNVAETLRALATTS